MSLTQKEIFYTTTNSYSTLNTLTLKTKNVWFVCHGMNYLSRYFLKYFDELNVKENYIIAPQAQSKFYLAPKFRHVGASWLTKENTLKETENVMRYFDAVFVAENIPENINLYVDTEVHKLIDSSLDFHSIIDIFVEIAETLNINLFNETDYIIGKELKNE